ncbi:MAG TPA: NADPH:quinone oxidoreductase family protein, partial [Mycobacteriales bacterium]|nr:NADPH:quinone oxidoreductase family protein [Mycobacteriales bacterium]
GLYQERPPLPFTPGLEVAGTVVAAGDGAAHAVGDRVIGGPPLPDGGLAELAVLPAGGAFAIPEQMPADEAAGLLITYQTAYVGLHRRAALRSGETLLVHAGAGGVGSAAIQVGLAAGASVIATAGGPEKVAVCRELGAHETIDYRSEDVARRVKEMTGGRGADVVWDPVGGDVFDASRRCIAFEGRLVVVGFTSGRIPEVPAGHLLVKNYSVVGLHWGLYRSMDPRVVLDAHEALTRLYAEGKVRPLVSERVPMAAAPEALTRLASRATVGKVVVLPGQ